MLVSGDESIDGGGTAFAGVEVSEDENADVWLPGAVGAGDAAFGVVDMSPPPNTEALVKADESELSLAKTDF
jgi:hypothetical protein